MLNRVNHFIKNITFNSGLNREKFINNKKIVNKTTNKNITKNKTIIVRKMSTYAQPSGNDNNNNHNNNNNNNDYIYMFIMALSASYIPNVFNKKNKKFIIKKNYYKLLYTF
jgi:hypothetical protein